MAHFYNKNKHIIKCCISNIPLNDAIAGHMLYSNVCFILHYYFHDPKTLFPPNFFQLSFNVSYLRSMLSIILLSVRRSPAKICQKFQLRHSKKMNKGTWTCPMCQPRLQFLPKRRKSLHPKWLRRLKVCRVCSYFPPSSRVHMLSGFTLFKKKVEKRKRERKT